MKYVRFICEHKLRHKARRNLFMMIRSGLYSIVTLGDLIFAARSKG